MSEADDELEEERQARSRCERSGLPFANLATGDIAADVVESVPGAVARRRRFVPVGVRGRRIVVALDALDWLVVDELSEILGRSVDVGLTNPRLLWEALERYYPDRVWCRVPRESGSCCGP